SAPFQVPVQSAPTVIKAIAYGSALADSAIGSATYTISYPALTITTPGLPGGLVSTAYSGATLAATGGTNNSANYAWTATGLPGGLTLGTTGALSGTPTAAGSFTNAAITVTD